jgi:hypothetical protein
MKYTNNCIFHARYFALSPSKMSGVTAFIPGSRSLRGGLIGAVCGSTAGGESFGSDIGFKVVGIELGDDGIGESGKGEWEDWFVFRFWDGLYQLLEQAESSRFGRRLRRSALSLVRHSRLGWR